MTVRVRFAPSPTGIPHIGNSRTALFNWLFAKHHQGKFVVRIEDTDRKRLVAGSQEKIMEILDVLGLKEDESYRVGGPYGPYIQSQRLELYQKYAHQLVEEGKAYYCFCSPERLAKVRREQQKKGLIPKYDRHCLHLSKDEVKKKLESGQKYVIRLKVPDNIDVSWDDLIQLKITISTTNIDDQILLKSDGYPTYHLAVVIDDHLMKINYVLRGAEWISSTPKHLLLYQAFGWQPPRFGHFPLILGPDKSKLSKRHGAKSVLDYVEEGYLPEALVNFMVFLGWNYEDNSAILSLEELVKLFDLDRIGKSNPIFDLQKLNYFNREHIRRLSVEELTERLKRYLPSDYPLTDEVKLRRLIELCQPRMINLRDFLSLTVFMYPDKSADEKELRKRLKEKSVIQGVEEFYHRLQQNLTWSVDSLSKIAEGIVEKRGLSKGKVYMALRVAVLLKPVTPPLFESMALLERKVVLKRLAKALEYTSSLA